MNTLIRCLVLIALTMLLAGCVTGSGNESTDNLKDVMDETRKVLQDSKEQLVKGTKAVYQDIRKDLNETKLISPANKYRNEALALEEQGDLPGALANWKTVIAMEPDDANAVKKIRNLSVRISAGEQVTLADNEEKQGNLYLELVHLRAASQLDPDKQDLSGRIAGLERRLGELATRHFNDGVSLYNAKNWTGARTAFVAALRYDPEHREAMTYLRDRLNAPVADVYLTAKGDTLAAIATKKYGDSSRAVLIARVNGLQDNATLKPQTRLTMPQLDRDFWDHFKEIPMPVPAKVVPEKIGTPAPIITGEPAEGLAPAESYCQAGEYQKGIAAIAAFRQITPSNLQADDLANRCYTRWALALGGQGQHLEAQTILANVAPEYQEREAARNKLKELARDEANKRYQQGVKYFVNEQLAEAIAEWEKTLLLDPEHEKAKNDIIKAQNLLLRLQMMK